MSMRKRPIGFGNTSTPGIASARSQQRAQETRHRNTISPSVRRRPDVRRYSGSGQRPCTSEMPELAGIRLMLALSAIAGS